MKHRSLNAAGTPVPAAVPGQERALRGPMPTLLANDLILFAHVMDAGSFTRAAQLTGLPKSTLSRRLTQLEQTLGERLLQRSTRRLILTEFGETVLDNAREMLGQLEAVASFAAHRQVVPQGTLRVSLPPEFREMALVELLLEYARRYPQVRLELDLSARRVDLVAERFDVAIRVAGRLPDDNTLVARCVATFENGLYASPGYLRRQGAPQVPEDLLAHVGLVLVSSGGEHLQWVLARDSRQWQGLPSNRLAANSLALLQELAVKDMGIVGLSTAFADPMVGEGRLVRVLPDWCLPPTPIWCVTAGRKLLPQRTLAFIELFKENLRRNQPSVRVHP